MNDSQIFKKIADELINNKSVRNVSELAQMLPYDQGYLSKLYSNKEEKKITPKIKLALNQKFGVSHNFMTSGIGEIFEFNHSIEDEPEKLTSYASPELLATMVEKLLKIIEGLQKDNDFYRTIAEDYMKGQPKESVSKVQKVKA